MAAWRLRRPGGPAPGAGGLGRPRARRGGGGRNALGRPTAHRKPREGCSARSWRRRTPVPQT
eukprot:2718112-Lingulodinium_polyedra.AAC.1